MPAVRVGLAGASPPPVAAPVAAPASVAVAASATARALAGRRYPHRLETSRSVGEAWAARPEWERECRTSRG